MSGLTEKQLAALSYYMSVEQNKTAAYKHAYDTRGMNARTINREAIRLFNNPAIKSVVDTAMAQAVAKVDVSVEWVLHRAKLLADFNLRKFMYIDDSEEGNGQAYYDFSNATEDDWYCLSEMCEDIVMKGAGLDKYPVERIKIKAESRINALRLVGEHVKVQAFKQQIAHTGHVLNMNTEEYKKARQEMLADDDC